MVLTFLIGNKKKQSSFHAPFAVRKQISESASTASSLCGSKDRITGQPLRLTSLYMFGTRAAFLQLRQQVPEALPPQSLLSESIRCQEASPSSLISRRSNKTTVLMQTVLCLLFEYIINFHGQRFYLLLHCYRSYLSLKVYFMSRKLTETTQCADVLKIQPCAFKKWMEVITIVIRPNV